jgi:hypothetical protein
MRSGISKVVFMMACSHIYGRWSNSMLKMRE